MKVLFCTERLSTEGYYNVLGNGTLEEYEDLYLDKGKLILAARQRYGNLDEKKISIDNAIEWLQEKIKQGMGDRAKEALEFLKNLKNKKPKRELLDAHELYFLD